MAETEYKEPHIIMPRSRVNEPLRLLPFYLRTYRQDVVTRGITKISMSSVRLVGVDEGTCVEDALNVLSYNHGVLDMKFLDYFLEFGVPPRFRKYTRIFIAGTTVVSPMDELVVPFLEFCGGMVTWRLCRRNSSVGKESAFAVFELTDNGRVR